MNILYVGDIMGPVGVAVVEELLPKLRLEHAIDLVIAQTENTTDGRPVSLSLTFVVCRKLELILEQAVIGACITTKLSHYLKNRLEPIIRPANYPVGTPGLGYKYVAVQDKAVLVVSLLGHIVGRDSDKPIDNPLKCIDTILSATADEPHVATIINFHGDYSSEKVIIGHYLDGRASAVIGDHWHVPTADARVLPGGTAHISDVGMCGALDASLGVSYASVVSRWRDGRQTRNVLEAKGARQFNAVLVKTNNQGLADSIEQIRHIL